MSYIIIAFKLVLLTLLLMIIVGVFVYAIILLCLRNFIGMTLCG